MPQGETVTATTSLGGGVYVKRPHRVHSDQKMCESLRPPHANSLKDPPPPPPAPTHPLYQLRPSGTGRSPEPTRNKSLPWEHRLEIDIESSGGERSR